MKVRLLMEIMLHSYASMHCITVLSYRNHLSDMYCHMFIVTLEFMSHRSREQF